MIKKLTTQGNSLALVIDRPILEATKITADTPLEISTNGDVIIVSPVRKKTRTGRFRDSYQRVLARYGGVFKRLAE